MDIAVSNSWLSFWMLWILYLDIEVNLMSRPYPRLLVITPVCCMLLFTAGHALTLFNYPRIAFMICVLCGLAIPLTIHTIVHASFRLHIMECCCNTLWSASPLVNASACIVEMTDCSFSIFSAALHLLGLFMCLHGVTRSWIHHIETAVAHYSIRQAYAKYLDRLRYLSVARTEETE
ncbi:hypothetical protein Ae201684P_010244 [Aphanomyces euteiches]|uniref:Uncharacterized protein n=1 Tax=Aphanomyces euteiches TaxID=100861 RepID=A0A6G0WZJ0_9STRA|nr:hypothetical protein Ae201684_009850 [Aphanomyces euteiches]KAH9096041.1 hypothetical protein Ae201684P_010244 [Aphanomyces euteiches]